jgi:uncharacterized protein
MDGNEAMSAGKTAECVAAITAGDTARLKELLDQDASLANAMTDEKRSMLHITADWPGHFPKLGESIRLLIAHGGDPSPKFRNAKHAETPLHGAASCDDVEAIDALLDGGADMEASGAGSR